MMSTLLTGPLATLTLSLTAWFLLVNAMTLTVFYVDDRRAAAGDWGIPDKTLLLLALIGGWPGAKLSQLIFRHGSTRRGFRTLLNLSILPMLGLVGYFATQGMDWAALSDQATAKAMAMLGQAPVESTGPAKPTVLVMGKSAGGTGPLAMQFGTSKAKPAGAWKPANAHPSLNLATALPIE